jgi:hypothetical protein
VEAIMFLAFSIKMRSILCCSLSVIRFFWMVAHLAENQKENAFGPFSFLLCLICTRLLQEKCDVTSFTCK